VFARPAELRAEVLYVVGGLYGNLPALREVERMAELEATPATLLFNGDFHVDADGFHRDRYRGAPHPRYAATSKPRPLPKMTSRLRRAYPESVPDADVDRSNR
jgi:hypothetical protein